MKPSLTEKYLKRFGHQYILLMMIVTRCCGSIGGLLVIFYAELTLRMPDEIRFHFRVSAIVVVVVGVTATVFIALWELRNVRRTLRRIHRGEPLDPDEAREAGREAVTFAARHHWLEAWFVPCTCLIPVLAYLRFWHDAPATVLINITMSVFMGIAMALMSTFFAVEHCMRPVIRRLLEHGIAIDYQSLPKGNLRFRLSFCSMLIIMTTALMIGALARQRAADIIEEPEYQKEAVDELRKHSVYITMAAVVTGVCAATVMAGSVTKRVEVLVTAMDRVGRGFLSERVGATGNDEVDILARQFNAMVERLDDGNRTIRDLNQNLEGHVRERTQQLEKLVAELSETREQLTENNRQLDVARIEAEAANQAKSDFLANISHELRTPLNGVIGMTELLMASPLNPQQRKYARTTKLSGTTLLDLLNEVLDFSKIEAGRLEVEKIPFDLHDTIDPVIELMAHRCREKTLEIGYFADSIVPPRLIGDPGRLRQIVSNLVSNAIKFTERGSVIVRIVLDDLSDGHARLNITVEDTGIGIPESRFDRLFQPFSQVDASTTRKYGGTGLGLAICKKLCELMGGEIGLESQVGRGSTFRLSLPFGVPESTEPLVTPHVDRLRGLRVLLASSSAAEHSITKQQFVNWGMHVCAVHSGKEAIKLLHEAALANEPYAVAIWDANVSDMSHEDFAAAVRSKTELKNTVLIPLMPVGVFQDPSQLRRLGFADCITKPVLRSSLQDALAYAAASSDHGTSRSNDERKGLECASAVPRTMRHGVKILLAEDNDINQQVAAEVLAHAGYCCEIVNDGKQAVESIKARNYDLVLMDCQMPELGGIEATRLVREHERTNLPSGTRPIPIIALTANALNGEYERCLAAGMTSYLSKPFDPIQLVEEIEAQLSAFELPVVGPPSGGASVAVDTRTSTSKPDNEPDAAPSAVFDFESLLRRCLGKRELAEKLLAKFHGRLESDLNEIAVAADSGDCERLASLAHRLKGTAANLSAETLSQAADRIERLARGGDLEAAKTSLGQLNHAGRRFLEETLHLGTSSCVPCPAAGPY